MCYVCPMRRQFEHRARLVIYVEAEDLAGLTKRAREAGKGVTEYARSILLGEQKISKAEVKQTAVTTAARPVVVPRPSEGLGPGQNFSSPQLKEATTATVGPGSQNFSLLQLDVARRTGHAPGCECFHCLQTSRFLAPPAPKKDEKKKATKKR